MTRKLGLFLGIWLLAATAPAVTNTWLGTTSSDWFTPANWSENRIPSAEDAVVVPAGWYVIMNSNAEFSSLELYGQVAGDVHVRTVLNWHSGDIGSSLTVHPNGLVNVSKTGPLLELYGSCLNAGTIRKTGVSEMTVQGLALANTGLLEVQAGTLELSSGLISSGTLSIADNAAVFLRGGTYDFAEGHRVIGNGTFAIVGNVEFQGALHDRLDWTSGTVSGNLIIAPNSVLNLTGLFSVFVELAPGTSVVNHGLVHFAKDALWVWGGGVVWHNTPSGVWDVESVVDLGGTTLLNAGTIRCRSPRLDLRLDVEHHGRIEVLAGHLTVRGRLLSDGQVFVAPDAIMSINDGILALREGHTVTGPGVFGFDEETQNVQIEDWIYSRLDWAGGVARGNIRIHSSAVLNLINPNTRYNHRLESPSVIMNFGTVNLFLPYDGMWQWGEDVAFYNAPGGLIEIGRLGVLGGQRTTLLNEGTIRTTQPSNIDFFMRFINAGMVELRGGAPRCVNGFVQTPAGSLTMHLDNSGPLLLPVEGTAQLAGRLAVGVDPALQLSPGTTVQVMTFGDRVGQFETFSGLGIAPGLRFNVLHQTSDVTLQVVVPQNRLSQARFLQNDFSFSFDGDADRLYEIQASTNLLSWEPIFTTNSQTGMLFFRDPRASLFRQRFYKLLSLPSN